ncbi:MAG: non-ribosomal peptide synthetase [Bryobacteraceae bacterium]
MSKNPYSRDAGIATLFEEVASARPAATALISDGGEVSYGELNRRANQLANYLVRTGVKPGDVVALALPRSAELITAMVAVLKAGAAYLPVDLAYPADRIVYLLQDAAAKVVIARSDAGDFPCPAMRLDAAQAAIDQENGNSAPSVSAGADLAYIMYTSGSTGRPKGVLVPQRGVVRLVRDTNYADLDEHQTILQFASISFDASTFEIWGALLNGGRLVLMPARQTGLDEIAAAIRRYGVTTMWLTAGLFHVMVDQHLEGLGPLRQLLAGGDVLSAPHVRRFLERLPNVRLINGYGPTENTTFTCCHTITGESLKGGSVPIGRPIAHTRVYLVAADGQQAAPGEAGEICAAGDGLADGYLNAADLTASKFVYFPFAPDERMYRTGDLGRFRDDGSVEFLGRLDGQVKVRGYRVEPGEIEAVLGRHAGVRQVVVTADRGAQTGDAVLTAYLVPNSGALLRLAEIREHARRVLPEFMMPHHFVELAALPLNANGKVDRAALPKPGQAEAATVVMRGRTEERVYTLWRDVLKRDRFPVDKNFFDLGGTSLAAAALHSRLLTEMGVQAPITVVFQYPTVRSMAAFLEERGTAGAAAIRDRAAKQRRLFARTAG